MEIGSFQQFFSLLFVEYGHLPTPTYCVQLWNELEPNAVHLIPASGVTWCPKPLMHNDVPIMEFAIKAYNKRGSKIINRCRMFLQIISTCYLLIYNTKTIHPAQLQGDLPPS
jgi:hypothetical protein